MLKRDMYENDHRTVMTLDAGGTNFVFSAIRGCQEVVAPVRLNAVTDDVRRCLDVLVSGFRQVEEASSQNLDKLTGGLGNFGLF